MVSLMVEGDLLGEEEALVAAMQYHQVPVAVRVPGSLGVVIFPPLLVASSGRIVVTASPHLFAVMVRLILHKCFSCSDERVDFGNFS